MRIDERDDRLGAELDRLARRVEALDRLPEVIRRGSHRRTARWLAIGSVLAIFVAAITWTGLHLRSDNGSLITRPGSQWPVYEGPGGDWNVSIPPDWHVTPIASDCQYAGYEGGVIVSSVPFDFHHPGGGVDGCDGRFVLDGFPRKGVALTLQPMGGFQGILVPEPDTAFPLGLSNLIPTGGIRGGPASAYLPIMINGNPTYRLGVWFGHAASLKDHDKVLQVVKSIDFPGTPRWITYRHPTGGFSVEYPSNWFRGTPPPNPSAPLASGHAAKKTLVVIASYRPALLGPNCGPFPSGISNLGFVNAMIVVTELPETVPYQRPDGFGPETATSTTGRTTCPGDPRPFRSWSFEFTDQGRSFRIDVASGVGDAGEVRNVVWRILNTLHFEPR